MKRMLCVGICLLLGLNMVSMAYSSDTPDKITGKALDGQLEPEFLEPAGFIWGQFQSNQGMYSLRYGTLPAKSESPIGTIIVVGGFSEFVEKYFFTLRDFHAWGYDVWLMDWRGQGGSDRYNPQDPQRVGYQGYTKDAADLLHFATDIVTPRGSGPLILVAHSMGAQISTIALHTQPNLFNKAILSAPMYGINTGGTPLWAVKALSWIMTSLGFGDSFAIGRDYWTPQTYTLNDSGSSQHPVRFIVHQDWYLKKPDLQLSGVTWGWLNTAFASQKITVRSDYAEQITTPILMASVGKDGFVLSDLHEDMCGWLPNCNLYSAPDAKHELFTELDQFRNPWLTAIKDFISE